LIDDGAFACAGFAVEKEMGDFLGLKKIIESLEDAGGDGYE
jgi:hypothetical protein